jgi:GTP-binding protein LepA
VDFSYEVSRSLSACEGALLVVDASQGVEAQTVANCYTALDLGVEVVPVLNKMDLPNADPDNAKAEIEDVIGIDADRCDSLFGQDRHGHRRHPRAGRRQGAGAQGATRGAAARDDHRQLVRQLCGRGDAGACGRWSPGKGERIKMMATGAVYNADNLGVFTPANRAARRARRRARWATSLPASRNCRRPRWATPSRWKRSCPTTLGPATEALPGFKEIQPQVFAGLYPTEASEYDSLRDAWKSSSSTMRRLHYEPEVSQALGFGFRCGFLGLLHMEIVQERLEREFDQDLITTAPSVVYEVVKADGEVMMVENPSKMPDQGRWRRSASPSSPCTCTCRRTTWAR